MFRKTVPSLSYPAFLDLVVTERIVSLASYRETTKAEFLKHQDPANSLSEPIRSLQFTSNIVPGQLPPSATGVYHSRLPNVRLVKPIIRGEDLAPRHEGRFFQARSYSLVDLDDPSLRSGEKSDAAVWVCGIDYMGYLHPFYNAVAYETATKAHPMRSVRMMGAPSALFVYQPFADMPWTECPITLKYNQSLGYRANVTGWIDAAAPEDFNYISHMDDALPKIALIAGGGPIGVDGKQTVAIELRDAAGDRIERDAVVYLEATGGFLPKQRVAMKQGKGSFPIVAMGLEPGDAFKIKAGFRNFSGVLDIPFTVV